MNLVYLVEKNKQTKSKQNQPCIQPRANKTNLKKETSAEPGQKNGTLNMIVDSHKNS